MSMFPWLDSLSEKLDKKARSLGERKKYFLDKEKSIKWMLRGLLFIPIHLIVDKMYVAERFSGTTKEDVLMVMVTISIIGILQFPVGLYYYLRNRFQDIEKGRDE